jgi:trans-2,3-dihydro-3-hydroxyanthranilate isomerase
MYMATQFFTVDVFTQKPFEGAQITVIPDAMHLTDSQMQIIAAEFNLWRTVFILPSNKATKKIRIFNAKREFDFGGHATIAAIFTLAYSNVITQQEGENSFTIEENQEVIDCIATINCGELSFNQYTTTVSPTYDRFTPNAQELGEMLSLTSTHLTASDYTPMLVATHIPYLIVPVDNIEALKAVSFNYNAWARSSAPSTHANAIFLFTGKNEHSSSDFHCRLVGPSFALHDDPPIGAAMSAFASYLGQFPSYHTLKNFIAERGTHQGRKSILEVEVIAGEEQKITIKLGGCAVLVAQGEIFI